MAIVLEANYSKKLGLPNFSSHQYSVTIRVELTDITQVEAESSRLYRLLQDAVDREMKEVGFIPEATTYGMRNRVVGNGNDAETNDPPDGHNGRSLERGQWKCSDKQRGLIEKFVCEKNLDKHEVEQLAVELFGHGVREMNKLEASGLIDGLFDRYGGGRRNCRQPYRRQRIPGNGGDRR